MLRGFLMTNILDYSNIKAKDYFLKSECYSNIDLPEYFNFENILQTSKNILLNKSITDFFQVSRLNDLKDTMM